MHHLCRVNAEVMSFGSSALPLLLPLGGMDVASTDTEEWKGEHNVENFVLCSFAHHAVRSYSKEELCKVSLTCHFSLDVLFLCQDRAVVCVRVFLELVISVCPLLQRF